MTTGISCRYEKHRATLNERAVLVGKRRANGYLCQPVSQGPRFTGILQLAHAIVIHRIVSHQSSGWIAVAEA